MSLAVQYMSINEIALMFVCKPDNPTKNKCTSHLSLHCYTVASPYPMAEYILE